jgi:hypothetical protein
MVRRSLAILLCALLLAVSTSAAYADATRKNFIITLEIETSYFSLDSFDDATDFSPRGGTINWSSREKGSSNFVLGAKVRRIKFAPPSIAAYEPAAQPRPATHDILRFQEVFRI